MTVYLDRRTSDYLAARNVNASNDTSLSAAVQSARDILNATLTTGDPIDPETVHFLMDYYDDSSDGFAALQKFLYDANDPQPALPGNRSRVDYYFLTLERPLTDALAPLIGSALFAPSVGTRDRNLYYGLFYAIAKRTPPPAESLTVLAQQAGTVPPSSQTGKALAMSFGKSYINIQLAANQPIDEAILNAYISIDPGLARTFIGDTLKAGNLDQKVLMDAYRQLNPNDAVPGYTKEELGLDDAFLTLTNSTAQPLTGWASLAVKQLLSRPDKPVDTQLLAQLKEVAPQAAAWVSWQLLKTQIATPSPILSMAALDTLGAYHQGLMISLCKQQLTDQLQRGNYLDTNAYKALQNVDRASADTLYSQYSQAGLAPPEAGEDDGLTAEDFATLSIGELMAKILFKRAALMGGQIKGLVAKMHAQNLAIERFQKLQIELDTLNKMIPAGTPPDTFMSALNPRPDDGGPGGRMNAILYQMPEFQLFPLGNGHYNINAVKYQDVKDAIKKVEDQLTSLSTVSQADQANMNMLNSNRNQAMEWLSSFEKELANARASVQRNFG